MQSAGTPEELLVTFDPVAEACVGTRCSGPNRAAPSTFGSAASKRLLSVAGVDRASSTGLAIGLLTWGLMSLCRTHDWHKALPALSNVGILNGVRQPTKARAWPIAVSLIN